jgi:hypothetical protein
MALAACVSVAASTSNPRKVAGMPRPGAKDNGNRGITKSPRFEPTSTYQPSPRMTIGGLPTHDDVGVDGGVGARPVLANVP